MSLTHLILNDMIKVKVTRILCHINHSTNHCITQGQISEIALCMEDTNSSIADFSRLFFHELAKKVMYSKLHHVISHDLLLG